MYYIINFQKGGTLPFCLLLMYYFDNFSTQALFYTAAHGTYGLVWLLKHCFFRDANWDAKQTILGCCNSFLLVLGPYWLNPYLLISKTATAATPTKCAVACGISILGMVIMCASDAQKHFTLRIKKGLITTGLFALCRHPNYLGEMMIYGGFAMMVEHWIGWAVLAFVWVQLFHTNILYKEASMSRYSAWPEYTSRTGMILPWLPELLCPSTKKMD